MRRASAALAASLIALVLGACANDSPAHVVQSDRSAGGANSTATTTEGTGGDPASTGPASTDPADPAGVAPIEWQDFGGDGRVQTGRIEVPYDYEDPSKGSFDLFVARHLADPDQRIGSLLVNRGGPGFPSVDFAMYADQVYSQRLLDRFDIVAWDPRGAGQSEPHIDCTDDYDYFFAGFDITPDDDAERQELVDRAKEFAADCEAANGDILPYIGTNNSARDMDTIRQALGEDEISYFGFSYGSVLGATWATMFPDTVRAAVLDGAADPNSDLTQTELQQSAGFEATLTSFLDWCSSESSCAFHNDGDAATAFDALMASIDEQPLPTTDGRPDLTRSMALDGVSMALYRESNWPGLADALDAAESGDGEGLLTWFDLYYERQPDGSYDNSLEAFQSIVCMDTADRPSVAAEDAAAQQSRAAAPRMSPGTTGGYFCTFFPESLDPRIAITGAGAGPILVMGTTGDPATPLASTRAMAAALQDGRLVIVTADNHTGYGVNQCSYDVVDDYLIDPVANAPENGTSC